MNLKQFIYLFSVLAIALFGYNCGDTEDPEPTNENPELAINLVTGINMTDEQGAPVGNVGNPNVYPGNLMLFPKPCKDVISVFDMSNFKNIWVTKGNKNQSFADIEYDRLLANTDYPTDSILLVTELIFELENQDVSQVNLNLENLSTGYYRVFVEMKSGDLFYDNIYVDKETPQGERVDKLVSDWN